MLPRTVRATEAQHDGGTSWRTPGLSTVTVPPERRKYCHLGTCGSLLDPTKPYFRPECSLLGNSKTAISSGEYAFVSKACFFAHREIDNRRTPMIRMVRFRRNNCTIPEQGREMALFLPRCHSRTLKNLGKDLYSWSRLV